VPLGTPYIVPKGTIINAIYILYRYFVPKGTFIDYASTKKELYFVFQKPKTVR